MFCSYTFRPNPGTCVVQMVTGQLSRCGSASLGLNNHAVHSGWMLQHTLYIIQSSFSATYHVGGGSTSGHLASRRECWQWWQPLNFCAPSRLCCLYHPVNLVSTFFLYCESEFFPTPCLFPLFHLLFILLSSCQAKVPRESGRPERSGKTCDQPVGWSNESGEFLLPHQAPVSFLG